jgi:iron complex outermembrane recepter protein
MGKMLLCIAGLMLFFLDAKAQESVRVQVVNEAGRGVGDATIELLKAEDSTLYKVGISDTAGTYMFEKVPQSAFIVKATSVNADIAFGTLKQGARSITIPLKTTIGHMQSVTVLSKKPFIQKMHDRLVVNVAGSIVASGSSALDILERSPGVTLDANENISLRGRPGVIIMIDGKQVNLSSADLVAYLKGMPSSMIERIDLITNPSARYDAAGSSGIIDIRLKKDQRFGANGTLTAGYGQGVYPKANGGSSFNYRNRKLNLYGSYNYNYRKSLNHLFVHWDFFNPQSGAISGGYNQDFFGRFPSNNHSTRLGLDYFLTSKTTLGILYSGNFNRFRRTNDNKTTALTAENTSDYVSLTNTYGRNMLDNSIYSVNMRHLFDSSGRELTVDADYGTYDNTALTDFTSRYFTPGGEKLRPNYVQSSDQRGLLKIHTLKSDYVHPFSKSVKMEAGFKSSYVTADNDLKFFDVSTGVRESDAGRTNRFIYHEYINAGYVNLRKEFKRWDVQLGVRSENTRIKGRQIVNDVHFDSTYLQFFPSAFVNYKLGKEAIVGLSLSRRIFRPDYSSLNPFVYFVDPSLYSTGNPSLKPEFTWSYEASYSRKGVVVTAGYGHTKNIINVVVNQADTNRMVSVQQILNLNSSNLYNIQAVIPVQIKKGWQVNTTSEAFYADYKGTVSNTSIANGGFSFSTDVNNQFLFGKGWSAELSGRYRSKTRQAFMIIRGQWGVNAGVQKQVLNNQGTLRFSITDIFWTNLPRASTHYVASQEHWHAYRETRVANVNFTYRFGNNKVQSQRRRNAASEDEIRRAGG